jgi:hypothetical protein
MHGVLPGAAAHLEHAAAVGELRTQHREDRITVALAGGAKGLASMPPACRTLHAVGRESRYRGTRPKAFGPTALVHHVLVDVESIGGLAEARQQHSFGNGLIRLFPGREHTQQLFVIRLGSGAEMRQDENHLAAERMRLQIAILAGTRCETTHPCPTTRAPSTISNRAPGCSAS